jgi:hypothetical protein
MAQIAEYREEPTEDIVGLHLKCAKGTWSYDDEKIETGPTGFQFTVLPPTAQHGRVKWVEGHPVAKALRKYDECDPGWEELPEGWSAYTSVLGIDTKGELLTFTSAYGARKTLKNIITQYRFRRRRQFPVCTLDTRPRGDANGNIDPVFKIVDWVNASDFADIFPEVADERPQLTAASGAAPSAAPEMQEGAPVPRPPITVTSGLAQLSAPPSDDEPFGGADPDDVEY